MMSDILTRMLSGHGRSMIRHRGEETHTFAALRIDAFIGQEQFASLMQQMIAKIHDAPALKGEPAAHPGEGGQ